MTRIYGQRPITPPHSKRKQTNQVRDKNKFKDLLHNKLKQSSKLNFSKHAKQRLQSRQIDFKEQDLKKLDQAVEKAKDKGAQESLILVNNNAYIVNVKNKTVITAMDEESMEENLFTNIDSAIVMK
ncbi:flagellar protein [Natroniella sulfidigena]|uniref:TIGR02530 family flagellar biosynthesis protein n=1 Tax=Natroniella sulfidigena TaxID=723921 RepID=UPI00200AE97B|nr:flagellar protein [Natroniella sulfidigena]